MAWAARIVKLGDAGKWHCCRVYGARTFHTACGVELADIVSSVMTVKVEEKNGEPTCKRCIRWACKQGYNV